MNTQRAAMHDGLREVVWVIDDDHELRGGLIDLLLGCGFDAIAFEDAAAAWNAIESDGSLPSAIVLDRDMPEMDGIEFRRRQLTKTRAADVPVIMFTGAGSVMLPGALVVPKSAGADALLGVLRSACAVRASERPRVADATDP